MDTYNTMSIFHLRDIISGKKTLIKSKDIKHVHVPQFPGLNVETMLKWAKPYPEVFAALPSEQAEIDQLHRSYGAKIIHTVAGEDFTEWIDQTVKERTKKIAEKRDLNIKMDPAI